MCWHYTIIRNRVTNMLFGILGIFIHHKMFSDWSLGGGVWHYDDLELAIEQSWQDLRSLRILPYDPTNPHFSVFSCTLP